MKDCFNTRTDGNGFTLIELLISIAIIGILTSIVFAAVNNARIKAQYAKAQAELEQFRNVAIMAQGESGKRLQDITGNNYSMGTCTGGRDLRNIPDSDQCYIDWINALTKIQDAAGGVMGLERLTRDPWGSPYLLDENEREGGQTDCRLDTIYSAGFDGIMWNPLDYSNDRSFFILPLTPCS